MAERADVLEGAYLQLHLEPNEPLEVSELTGALNAFARRYQVFAAEEEAAGKAASGKLLVASVAPGSIDINFIPDALIATAPLIPQMVDQAVTLAKFAVSLKSLVEAFAGKKPLPADVDIRDCDDSINIVKPIADRGGTQVFNVFNGPTVYQKVEITSPEAQKAVEGAVRKKAELQF